MQPKIRVLYVIDALGAGGVESQLVELIAHLDRERFDPHVLALYGAPLRPPHFLDHLRALDTPVRMLNLGMGAGDKVQAVRHIIAATWSLRPHIMQAENYHSNLLTRAARPALPRAVRLVGAIRVAYTPRQLRYERLNSWLCDVIVASADYLRAQLIEEARVAPRRVVVIPNSVDVERFGSAAMHSETRSETRARIAPNKRRLLISVGRISQQKRMDLFAEALGLLKREGALLDDVRVAMIGPSEEQVAQQALDAVLTRDGLSELVVRIPIVSDPEAYFAACDASVLASEYEGLPIVALESLAAGKPVLLTAGANLANVIEPGVTGWVAPTNAPTDLAAALRQLLAASDEELAEMSSRCRAAAERYSIQTLVHRYMAVYAALTSPASSGRAAERTAALTEALTEATR